MRAGFDVVRYVGNVNTDLKVPVVENLHRQRVVKILGIHRVDSERSNLAHIPSAFQVRFGQHGRNSLSLLLNLGRESNWQPEFGQNGMHFGIVLPGKAQYGYNLALKSPAITTRIRVFGKPDYDLVAIVGITQFFFWDVDVLIQFFAIGHHKSVGGPHLDTANNLRTAALDYLRYFTLGPSATVAGVGVGYHPHPVAVYGSA